MARRGGTFRSQAVDLVLWITVGVLNVFREQRSFTYAAAHQMPVSREHIFLMSVFVLLILLTGWRLISLCVAQGRDRAERRPVTGEAV